jgi:hypothetical protein
MNSVAQTSHNDLSFAFQLGKLDAEDGVGCVPEMYFARRSQIREYARAYESVAGPTMLSQQILAPVATAESTVLA